MAKLNPILEKQSIINFFFILAKTFAAENSPLLRVYREVVELIPTAWDDPDNIGACLVINDQKFQTKYFNKCKAKKTHEIIIDDVTVGNLTIGFALESGQIDDDAFAPIEDFISLLCNWLAQVTMSSQIKTMIKKSDIKFRALVNDAKEGIYICDLNGNFIYSNYALASTLGGTKDIDINGKNFVDFLPPDRKITLRNQFLKSLETGIISPLIETEIIRADGSTGFIEIKPSTFVIEGKVAGNQGIVLDVTERKLKEKELMHKNTHDSLTGLYNRTFFDAEMKRIERGRQFPVSFVILHGQFPGNLDENDQDIKKFMKRVAHNLFATFRGDDIVARIGDNDFGILLPNVSEQNVDVTVQRINTNIFESGVSANMPIKFYLGVSTAQKGEDLNSALNHAYDIINLSIKKDEGA